MIDDFSNPNEPKLSWLDAIIGGFSLLVGVMFALGLVLSGLGLLH
jgi:hypothetical protein